MNYISVCHVIHRICVQTTSLLTLISAPLFCHRHTPSLTSRTWSRFNLHCGWLTGCSKLEQNPAYLLDRFHISYFIPIFDKKLNYSSNQKNIISSTFFTNFKFQNSGSFSMYYYATGQSHQATQNWLPDYYYYNLSEYVI